MLAAPAIMIVGDGLFADEPARAGGTPIPAGIAISSIALNHAAVPAAEKATIQ